MDLAIGRFGRLDVLVNNAGIFIALAATEDYRLEDFDHTLRHNLRTAFLMTKFALPHLQKSRGNIICAGSEAGIQRLARNSLLTEALQGLSARLYDGGWRWSRLKTACARTVSAPGPSIPPGPAPGHRVLWTRPRQKRLMRLCLWVPRHPGRDGEYLCLPGIG